MACPPTYAPITARRLLLTPSGTGSWPSAYIEPGSPWENVYYESFNARFRDELLDREILYNLRATQILIEHWRRHYNTKRPLSALDYRTPTQETIVPMGQRPIIH